MSNVLAAVLGQVANTITQEAGSRYGVAVHWAFALALRLLNLPRVEVEQSFDREGDFADYGVEGSVRTDVLLRSHSGKIIAVWDVKTNKAYSSRRRARQIREWLKIDDGVPVIELHVQRGKAILR